MSNSEKTMEGLDSGKLVAVPFWLGVLNYLNPVAFIVFVFYIGQKTSDYENRMMPDSGTKERVIQHLTDGNMHMSLDTKLKFFVPRTEVEIRLNVMQKNQEKIMKKLNVN